MRKFKFTVLLVFILTFTSSFSIGYVWVQAWVEDIDFSKTELPKSLRKQIAKKELTLILLSKKDLITTPLNGNTYLKCYLVNNTDSIALIGRADHTLRGFSTEVFKDQKWQHFQGEIGPSCGNSYWTQNLSSNKVLSLQVDHSESGSIKIPFRARWKHNDLVIYSNEIMIDIDQKNFDRIGKSAR